MITRIVRMEFEPEKVNAFLEVFDASKPLIRAFPGVLRLELHRDASMANVFYTLSEWTGEEALEAYRQSELFEGVWAKTKVLFSGKPRAYSLVLWGNGEMGE
jgi:(4S)-4-hydroxy-5-phosphonooxypentane-2,3-dione isomerase